MTDQPMQIREFEDGDWPAIWPIFREVVSARDTYAYDPDWSEDEARDVWVMTEPGSTVVARAGDEVLGTAQMGPKAGPCRFRCGPKRRCPDARPGLFEIGRQLVAAAAHIAM